MGLVSYINGRFVPKEEAVISIYDHGFLYGDGIFEGIRAYHGRIFRLDAHLDRLYDSAKYLMLDIPLSKEEVKQAILETVRRSGLQDAYIRPIISRGIGDLGVDPRKCKRPTVVIIVDTIQLYPKEAYERGLRAITATTRKTSPNALSPQAKTLNYLNNIMARIEATQAGADEAIMLTAEGYVAECSADNLFIVRGGELWTPAAYLGILRGITRGAVLDLAHDLGIRAIEGVFTSHELYTANECFLTGTGAEVGPVVEVDGRPIGSGAPGPISLRIVKTFRDLVQREGTPVYPAGVQGTSSARSS